MLLLFSSRFFFLRVFFLILCIKRTLHILVECKFSDTTKSVIIFSDGQGCNFSHTIRTNEIMLYFAIKTSKHIHQTQIENYCILLNKLRNNHACPTREQENIRADIYHISHNDCL